MSLAELLPSVRSLAHHDKLRLLQFLAGELARDEQLELQPGEQYPIYSPYDCFEAAEKLRQVLEAEERSS